MPSTAIASHNSIPPQRENFRPVSSDLRLESPPGGNRPPADSPKNDARTGTPKWSTARKNFLILKMPDGREVFLHADDFSGDWPPPYRSKIKFNLLETGHKTCPLRAKDAEPVEAK